jgi:hypothetical protein
MEVHQLEGRRGLYRERYLLLGRRHRKHRRHRQAGPVHVDSRIRENSVPIVENRHRKPSGPVAVDRLTVEISAPTAESRERKNRGQIPDTSCKIDVLMVESFK